MINDLGGSSYNAILAQYTDSAGSAGGTIQFGGSWSDGALPPQSVGITEVYNEVDRAMTQNGWPDNLDDQFVVLPQSGTNVPGFGSSFCAWHAWNGSTVAQLIPFEADQPSGCGWVGGSEASATAYFFGHEYAESATDPTFSGWCGQTGCTDPNTGITEIGDLCYGDAPGVALFGYQMPYLWDNASNSCAMSSSGSPFPTPTPQATATSVATPTLVSTPTPQATPTSAATPTPLATSTPQATATPGATPTPAATPTSAATPRPSSTPIPTPVRVRPQLGWTKPADITYPTPLSSTQLDAYASVSGTFAYRPSSGTIIGAGMDHTLKATFTPFDLRHYMGGGNVTATLTVLRKKLEIVAYPRSLAYSQRIRNLSWHGVGWADAQSRFVLQQQPTCRSAANAARGRDISPAGVYRIKCWGARAANYSFTYVWSWLSVTLAPVRIRYVGRTDLSRGSLANVWARIRDPIDGAGVPGRILIFSLGEGRPQDACVARPTSSAGAASCKLRVWRRRGFHKLQIIFPGDSRGRRYDYGHGELRVDIRVR